MERKNHDQDIEKRESEGRGIPPPPRSHISLKSSPKIASPSFRFATMQPPAATSFMAPSQANFPFASPTANVNAEFHMEHDGPTRSATLPLKPFAISKEHVGPRHLFSKPVLPSKMIPVFDLKQKAKSVTWTSPKLNKVPRYYPLERINRRITLEESPLNDILSRISDGFRVMSVQAKYFNRPASAALLTPENVELYVTLWESDDGKDVIVEVQRRRGDAIIFHHYAHHILDAASGRLDEAAFANDEGSILYLQSTEKKLRSELSRIAPDSDMDKESVVALEIVYELLQKERSDARQLGMEGMCILANARKTVLTAAIATSRAILLGGQTQASQGLHEILLGVILKRRIGDIVSGGDYPEDSDDEEYFLDDDEEIRDYSPEYKEEITLLFNLALNALSHALEVATTFGVDTTASPDQSAAWAVDEFLVHAMRHAKTNLLSTLLQILQRAYLKPHNAWLAAKCLRFICTASPSAKERLVNLGAVQSVETAYDVGIESHAKLESECHLLQSLLT